MKIKQIIKQKTKKKQIEKHDYVGEMIWKEVYKYYKVKEEYNRNFIENEKL